MNAAKGLFYRYWPVIVGVLLFLAFGVWVGAQAPPPASSEKPITYVDKIDVAHVVAFNATPRLYSEGDTNYYVCDFQAVHDDGAVFRSFPYMGMYKDDDSFIEAMKGAFDGCKTASVNLVKDLQNYYRAMKSVLKIGHREGGESYLRRLN